MALVKGSQAVDNLVSPRYHVRTFTPDTPDPGGEFPEIQAVALVAEDGERVTSSNPFPVTVISGGGVDPVGLKNTSATPINPATEDTLASLNAKDFATQTTLSAINAKLVTGTDIGDVTINNAVGASAVNIQDGGNSITVDNSTLAVVGGGTEATALRVTIANNSTGVLSVDDNGGSLTVDGTVAATQSGAWNVNNVSGTVSLPTGAATSANQSTIIGHVDGIEALLTTIDADTSSLASEDFATQTTLAAINSKLVSGTDIGDVTINNAAGASAVNIQDGGNSITVDGSVTANAQQITSITTQAIVSVGASDTQILASNTSRKGGYIKNLSDAVVFVALATAATTSHYPLYPGEVFPLVGDGYVLQTQVKGITASGSKNVWAIEF